MHLVEIIVFYYVIIRPIKIINRSDKNWETFLEKKQLKFKKINYKGWSPKKRKF